MKSTFVLPLGLVAAILFVTSGAVLGASWEAVNTGLPVTLAGVTALTVDPSAPSTIYARTTYGGVFKSTDGGGNWKAVSNVTGVSFLAVDPKDSSTLYAVANNGLVKSTDGGETWIGLTGLTGVTRYPSYSSVTIDPITPSTLYVVTYPHGVFKSTNRGADWTAVNSRLPTERGFLPAYNVTALAIDPVTPSKIYARTHEGYFKSMDGAESWSAITSPGRYCNSLTIDPLTPSTLYVICEPDVVGKSTDGGQTWTALSTGISSLRYIASLAIDPATSSNIYLSYRKFDEGGWGALKSTDAGQSWSVLNTGLPPYNTGPVVAVIAAAPTTVYAGYADFNIGRGRLVKSVDGGTSWDAADASLTYVGVRVLGMDPRDPFTLYTGMGEGYVFKSVNSGASWSKLAQFWADDGRVHSLQIDPSRQNILYAATTRAGCNAFDKLLFRSTDGGESWTDHVSPNFSAFGGSCNFTLWAMAINPTDPDTLYLGGTENTCGTGFVEKSANDGATWSFIGGFDSGVTALVIDPTTPATLYVAFSIGLAKSTNGGASWSILPGVQADVLAMDPTDPNRLYAAANSGYYFASTGSRGLFKSTDSGATWLSINRGLEGLLDVRSSVTALAIAPGNPDVLYAATAGGGVYKSPDGGSNWVKFNDGLTNLDVRALAVASGVPTTLYAATSGGIFKVIDETSGRDGIRARR